MFLLGFQANSKKRAFRYSCFGTRMSGGKYSVRLGIFEPEVDVDWISTNAANGRP